MGFLLIVLLVALLVCINVALISAFRRRLPGPPWWRALVAAWMAGAGLGVWSGFFFEYRPDPRLRILGAPIPAICFQWEGPSGEERWVDYVTPDPLLFAGSNVVILALLAGCLVGLAYWFQRQFLATPENGTARKVAAQTDPTCESPS
jgi:hypothetical protein